MRTVDEAFRSRLDGADRDLLPELSVISLSPMGKEDLEHVLNSETVVIADHHGVAVPAEVRWLAMAPPAPGARRAHPGLAIDRLDLACARAAMRGDGVVQEADVGLAATPRIAPPSAEDLERGLGERVRGQDTAIARVAKRLALTRARLDLRPERPDGVFLFVGPTGVGKTELARAVSRVLYGHDERLIRLDMSEYSEEWSISRLIGPQPGYVGFTEPDNWLTTRANREPESVVLLDEIEKAHPAVWNAFLQVFDAGRLTDPHGTIAEFSRTVVIMTSNLGGGAFSAPALGFADRDEESEVASAEARVVATVQATMRPELMNRLDDIIVFRPLDVAAITEIAMGELDRLVVRLEERGYRLAIDPSIASYLAQTGYDPAYGARHLHRNIERLLLEPLTSVSARALKAVLIDDGIGWRPLKEAPAAS